jgi:hypothetical protein
MTREQEIQQFLSRIWFPSGPEHELMRHAKYLLDQLTAAQATNAQRDARLFKAGLEAAQEKCRELHVGLSGKRALSADGADGAWRCHESIRALANDDAAIQAAVEKAVGADSK